MSAVRDPVEKKRLSYERDHYNRGGESDKAWRRAKPLKKVKARRAYRKAANDLVQGADGDEGGFLSLARKQLNLRQRRISDRGAVKLRNFVQMRLESRALRVDAKRKRRAREMA